MLGIVTKSYMAANISNQNYKKKVAKNCAFVSIVKRFL